MSEDPGTYVATDTEFTHNVTHSWNHGLGEVVTALLDAGMQLTGLTEHQSVPWQALPGQMEQLFRRRKPKLLHVKALFNGKGIELASRT